MEQNQFTRLHLCSSIYYKFAAGKLCIAYAHVDDFVFGGTDDTYTQTQIKDFRALASTSEPSKTRPACSDMKSNVTVTVA